MLGREHLREGFLKGEKLLGNPPDNIDIFTDEFLDVLEIYQNKVSQLLNGKTPEKKKEILNKNADKKIQRAIDLILKYKKPECMEIGYALFEIGESKLGVGSGEKQELKTLEKYEEFLKVYYTLFFGKKEVHIDVFQEMLDARKMRQIPYKIIHFYGVGVQKTFLISDEVGQATFVYEGIIEIGYFRNIQKGASLDGKEGKKIIYGKNYAQRLEAHLQESGIPENKKEILSSILITQDEGETDDFLKEEGTFQQRYHTMILSRVTDKEGNSKKVDFSTIGMMDFSKLYFGRGTRFGIVNGKTLLRNNGGNSLISLKKILGFAGINRPDLPQEEIDYTNRNHIEEVLKIITDKEGNSQKIDLNIIGVNNFSKLYFGRGTRFGQIGGPTLFNNNGGINSISLKKILGCAGINRPDLSQEEIAYTSSSHVGEVLKNVTDKEGNPQKIDLKTIGIKDFSKLYFGRGTRFGQICGVTLLKNNGGINSNSLKKILEYAGINRSDLGQEEIDYTSRSHIEEVLKNITDKEGNPQKINLNTIGIKEFLKLYFGRGTRFGQIGGVTLLKNNGGENLISMKKILGFGGIHRPDLPQEDIDYTNSIHIQEVLKIITDKDGISQKVDFNSISMTDFSKLYFGRGGEFGQIGGAILLKNNGGENLVSLKKVLSCAGINRPDLPQEEIDYTNRSHIEEVLKVITDKEGNPQKIDFNTISMTDFLKLYFGRGTRFGQIGGFRLLKNNGGNTLKSLKKVLFSAGIERLDIK